MKHDYNIFTKAELVGFMQKHGNDFRYISKPYDVILTNRLDTIDEKINKNIEQSKKLTKQLDNNRTFENAILCSENHKKWRTLQKERDKVEALLFPRETTS